MGERKILPALTLVLSFSMVALQPIPATDSTDIKRTQVTQEYSTTGNGTAKPRGGTLRIARGEPPYFNPILMRVYDVLLVTDLLFNSLVKYNETLDIVPDLAESWESSPDGKNYTFDLKPGIRWHDGNNVTGYDVKFTFDTIIRYMDTICKDWYDAAALSVIDSIDANASTVVFRLKNVFSCFLSKIAGVKIIPKHLYEGTDIETNEYNWKPVGTGPFKFTEYISGSHLRLSANEDYYEGRPYLDGVLFNYTIPAYPYGNEWEHLADNQIDVVVDWLNPNYIDQIRSIPGKTVTTTPDLNLHSLGINCRNPPLNYTKVRQAIAYATNISKIIEVTYLGFARLMTSPVHPNSYYWHNPDLPVYGYNQTLAEKLLDEAGYPRSPEWMFNLTLKVGDWDDLRINASKLIKEDLEAVGIGITIQIEPWHEIIQEIFVDHQFNITTAIAWELWPDPDYLYDFFHSRGRYNAWGYNNSALDTLLELQRIEMNTTKRQEYIYQIQQILTTDLPNIPLYHKIGISGYNNDFYGFLEMPKMFAMISADSLKKVYYDETLSGEGKSPVRIAFIDSNERRTGWNPETRDFVTEIPNSSCLPDKNIVKIRSATGNYTLEVYGTGNGTYNVETVSISSHYKYVDVQEATIQENQTRRYYITVHQDGNITVRAITLPEEPPQQSSDEDNQVPKFPSFIIMPLMIVPLAIATLLIVIVYRRKHSAKLGAPATIWASI